MRYVEEPYWDDEESGALLVWPGGIGWSFVACSEEGRHQVGAEGSNIEVFLEKAREGALVLFSHSSLRPSYILLRLEAQGEVVQVWEGTSQWEIDLQRGMLIHRRTGAELSLSYSLALRALKDDWSPEDLLAWSLTYLGGIWNNMEAWGGKDENRQVLFSLPIETQMGLVRGILLELSVERRFKAKLIEIREELLEILVRRKDNPLKALATSSDAGTRFITSLHIGKLQALLEALQDFLESEGIEVEPSSSPLLRP